MTRSAQLDQFHWHEARVRAMLVAEIFDACVSKHAAIKRTPTLRKKAMALSRQLRDFHQLTSVAESQPPDSPARKKKRLALLKNLFNHPVPHDWKKIKRQRRGRTWKA